MAPGPCCLPTAFPSLRASLSISPSVCPLHSSDRLTWPPPSVSRPTGHVHHLPTELLCGNTALMASGVILTSLLPCPIPHHLPRGPDQPSAHYKVRRHSRATTLSLSSSTEATQGLVLWRARPRSGLTTSHWPSGTAACSWLTTWAPSPVVLRSTVPQSIPTAGVDQGTQVSREPGPPRASSGWCLDLPGQGMPGHLWPG